MWRLLGISESSLSVSETGELGLEVAIDYWKIELCRGNSVLLDAAKLAKLHVGISE